MGRYGRDAEEIRLETADAIGNVEDVIEHFRTLSKARGWTDGE